MIYKFRIVSDEVNNFKREITIDSGATFEDLKNAICDSVNYDKNMLSSFFICNEDWDREKEITFEEMDSDSGDDRWLMDDTTLDEMIEDEGQKLQFVFDYVNDRGFFMEMKELVPGRNLKDPVCSLSLGQAPKQIEEPDLDFDDLLNKGVAKNAKSSSLSIDDLEEEYLDGPQYNDDEFTDRGFSEMEF